MPIDLAGLARGSSYQAALDACVNCGAVQLQVSYPALGCGALMGAGNDTDAVKIVHRAIELGVNCTPCPHSSKSCSYSPPARPVLTPQNHVVIRHQHAHPAAICQGPGRTASVRDVAGRRVNYSRPCSCLRMQTSIQRHSME